MPEVEAAGRKIRGMEVRGATRIAQTAVECLRLTAAQSSARSTSELVSELDYAAKYLLSTRPTAVSLPNGVRYVMYRALTAQRQGFTLEEAQKAVLAACEAFLTNTKEAVARIAEIGARRINDGDTLMTHCHSNAVVSILKKAKEQGKNIDVYVTETRPLYQGRIVAETLDNQGIPVTLIVDGAARYFMKRIDKVVVGADAVASNGAVVNKIGTSMVALAAHESRTLFFVAAETYKFSPETIIGELIKIEERPPDEVIPPEMRARWKNVQVRNPSFDVTPPEYIDLIITERGIIPPQAALTVLQQELGQIPFEDQQRYSTYLADDLE
ncbi:MAG: ribose 1,5-bisphosphate isomerase [Candidatus Bathyarchaeia archaeon]